MKPKKQKYPTLTKRKQDEILAPILGEKPTLTRKLAKRIKQGMFDLIPALKPPETLKEYLGRQVRLNTFDDQGVFISKEGPTVIIESIVGSMPYPTRFEINGEHHVVILDFYHQMNGEEIDEVSIKDFDQTTFEVEKETTAPRVKEVQNESH